MRGLVSSIVLLRKEVRLEPKAQSQAEPSHATKTQWKHTACIQQRMWQLKGKLFHRLHIQTQCRHAGKPKRNWVLLWGYYCKNRHVCSTAAEQTQTVWGASVWDDLQTKWSDLVCLTYSTSETKLVVIKVAKEHSNQTWSLWLKGGRQEELAMALMMVSGSPVLHVHPCSGLLLPKSRSLTPKILEAIRFKMCK